jgi:hypothetical protein
MTYLSPIAFGAILQKSELTSSPSIFAFVFHASVGERASTKTSRLPRNQASEASNILMLAIQPEMFSYYLSRFDIRAPAYEHCFLANNGGS